MKGLYLVEPLVALYAFAGFLVYPLIQQFVYRRLWEQLTNTSYPEDDTTRCEHNNTSNTSSNHSAYYDEVQRQASLFSLYTEVFSTVPSLVVTLLLVAHSDRRGRKVTIILPLVGGLVYFLSFLAVSYFRLSVYFLLGASLASSLFGGVGTFLGGCFAYVADRCAGDDERHKTLRMATVDMVIGLVSGVASLSTGYFLQATGFEGPILTAAGCQALSLLYAVFVLEETVKRPPPDAGAAAARPSCGRPVWRTVRGIYRMLAGAGCGGGGRVRLLLLMLTFASFNLAYFGGLSPVTLYELRPPLCWGEVLIGYGAALSTGVFVASFLGVAALTLCGAPPLAIVLLGLLSVICGLTLTAFATTTLAMFLVRIPLLLAVMPYPVLRTLMSKLVSSSQQGSLFACVAFLESLTSNVATAIFSSIYAATVSWWPGFTFLLAAGLCTVPCILVGVVALLKAEEAQQAGKEEEEEEKGLVSAEVEPGGGEDGEAMQA